ncbi:hypothetical protein SAMN05421869_12965 [Nonomuraea jiangxiensis]|uniref:Uncharacterized protein n=1 Tax=Nonomuraea jiangxiensis TaxID=633440 RepID=A0A1G9M6R5_9ACTN|nr:hypothetical protein SAMN05421869_12965 [Nonomuraea jiangxiensis]
MYFCAGVEIREDSVLNQLLVFGERDDVEDAQWMVVVEGLDGGALAQVDELVERYEGWREAG